MELHIDKQYYHVKRKNLRKSMQIYRHFNSTSSYRGFHRIHRSGSHIFRCLLKVIRIRNIGTATDHI